MPPKKKGGIRKRLGLDASARGEDVGDIVAMPAPSEPSSSSRRAGIRNRVGADVEESGGARIKRKCTGPLVSTLKKQWGKGELSARQVEDIVTSAEHKVQKVCLSLHPRSTHRICTHHC